MILDTNALSAFIDGEPKLEGRLATASQVAIPVIVLGEFRYGIVGSRHRAKYESWLTRYLADFEILAVTEPPTLVYARVGTALKKAGRPIPANDAWIAALALQHRRPVLTRDEHFDVVPGLHRETW